MKLLLVSLLPVATASWMLTPRFYPSLLDTMLDTTLMSPTTRFLTDRGMPAKSSPKYEITDTDEQIQIIMDVPGVEKDNLDISVHHGEYSNTPVISISGHRETKDDTSQFSYKFSQSFSLPANIDIEHFVADLTNGVLTVTAPKDTKRLEANVRKIPILAGQQQQNLMNSAVNVQEESQPKNMLDKDKKEPVAMA